MAYHRTAKQKIGDFAVAREFEEEVARHLPAEQVTMFDHSDALDVWIPGYLLDVKEKRQRLTKRWQLLPGVDEVDLIVLDELGIRRALRHWPAAYFLMRDLPQDRLFLASITEVVCAERVRRQRVGKGKWILDLNNFLQVDSLDDVHGLIVADQAATPWKLSGCLGHLPVGQV